MRLLILAVFLLGPCVDVSAQKPDRATIDQVLARTTYVEVQRFRLTGGRATAVAFSPDDRFLAVGGERGDVLVFDVTDPTAPRQTAAFDAADAKIVQLAFAGEGDGRIVVKSEDVSIWGVGGLLVRRVPALYAAVSPDGRMLTYASHIDAGVVRIERIDDGDVVAEWASKEESMSVAGFSEDGDSVIGSGGVGWIWTWNWRTDEPPTKGHLTRWPLVHRRLRGKVPADLEDRDPDSAVANGGSLTATAERTGVVRLRLEGEVVSTVGGLAEAAQSLAFTGDGAHLVAGRYEETVVFDRSGTRLALDRGGPVARGPGGHSFVQVVRDELEVVDARTGRVTRAVAPPPARHPTIARVLGPTSRFFGSPRGDQLVVGGSGRGTWWVDLVADEWQRLDEFDWPRDAFWSFDGRVTVAALESRGTDILIRSGSIVRRDPSGIREVPSESMFDPAVSVSLADDGGILYRAYGARLVATTPDAAEPLAAVDSFARWFRPLDANLGVSHDGYVVTLWDLHTLQPLRSLSLAGPGSAFHGVDPRLRDPMFFGGPSPVLCTVLSPDRQRLAIAGMRDVIVWELRRDR